MIDVLEHLEERIVQKKWSVEYGKPMGEAIRYPTAQVFFFAEEGFDFQGHEHLRFFSVLICLENEEFFIVHGNPSTGGFGKRTGVDRRFFERYAKVMKKLLVLCDGVTFIGDKEHASWIDSMTKYAFIGKERVIEHKTILKEDCFTISEYSAVMKAKLEINETRSVKDLPTLLSSMSPHCDYAEHFDKVDSQCRGSLVKHEGDPDILYMKSKALAVKAIYNGL